MEKSSSAANAQTPWSLKMTAPKSSRKTFWMDSVLGNVDQKHQSYFPRSSFRIAIAILGDALNCGLARPNGFIGGKFRGHNTDIIYPLQPSFPACP
jgi:hypothetical protein